MIDSPWQDQDLKVEKLDVEMHFSAVGMMH
jgi:hypothetical protein